MSTVGLKSERDCQYNTGEIEQGELGAAPVLFNGGADEVVEKQTHHHPDDPVVLGNEDPGQKAPDFTAEDGVGVKGQDGGSGILGKGVQKKDCAVMITTSASDRECRTGDG